VLRIKLGPEEGYDGIPAARAVAAVDGKIGEERQALGLRQEGADFASLRVR
jgi:hypothetical protein